MGNNQGKSEDNLVTDVSPRPSQTRNGESRPDSGPSQALHPGVVNENEQKSKIPRELFIKFINCLKSLPFEISEDQFQDLASSLEIVTFKKSDVILKIKEKGQGVFLVVDGHCEVVAESNVVIRVIEDGDYFGEISAFYSKPCTATVLAGDDDTRLLLLPEDVLGSIMSRPVEYPVLKWYVKRRYLDLENTAMQDTIVREITRSVVNEAPPFFTWSSEAIDAVVGSVVPNNIICYPAGADVFFCDDTDANAYLLMQGSIEIFSSKEQSLEIFNPSESGLWFGDEQLFCRTKRQITAKAYTPCLLVTFTYENFQAITENFPIESARLMDLSTRWRKLVDNRNADLSTKYDGQLCVEMSRLMLRKSNLLGLAPSGMLYIISLGIIWRELNKGHVILEDAEQRNSAFIVYSGTVTAASDSKVIIRKLKSCDMFFPTDNDPDDLVLKADEQSLVGIFELQTFREAEDMYPNAIVNWESIK